jgi:hypothetical protein
MIIKNTAATLGAALILAGAPALASAATTTVNAPSPVRLDNVQIAQYYGQFNNYFPGLVTVSFTNQAAKPVTNIVFDLEANDGQVLRQYDDAGNYAQGSTVRHSFSDTEVGAGQSLAVESVTFADGTVWNNADTMPSRRQSQAASAPTTDASLPEYN